MTAAMPGAAMLLGALFALDDAVCVSLLISEPVFAGALFGAVTGRFEAGVLCGALLQCVWIATLRVGGVRPPEGWLAAVAATSAAPAGLAFDHGAWLASESLAPALLWGVACASAGAKLRAGLVRSIERGADRAVARAVAGDLGAVNTLHRGAAALHLVRGALAAFLAVALGTRFAALVAPAGLLAPAGWIAFGLGCVALGQTSGRGARWTWGVGGLAGVAWAWWGGGS